MPQKSRMSMAASKKRSSTSIVFVCSKSTKNKLNDEFYDMDDDLISGFKTDEDDDVDCANEESVDESSDVITEEAVLELTEKVMKWREIGYNCGVRGAGTSGSTYYRNLSKKNKTVKAGKISKFITGWLSTAKSNTENLDSAASTAANSETATSITSSYDVSTASNTTSAIASITANATASEINVDDVDIDESIFGVLDQYNIFGETMESSDREDGPSPDKTPAHTVANAIKNLLASEANVTRNVQIEKKSNLMAYQRIQAIAIVRYLQMLQEGKSITESSADVAMTLYQKKVIWSYKSRSIRGWAEEYMLTGSNPYL